MLRMGQIDHALGQTSRWGDVATEESGGAANIVALNARERTALRAKPRFGWAVPAAAAAALAVVSVLAFRLLIDHDQFTIRTQIGERRELTLTDGSTVEVAPYTELSVRMEPKQRLIKLSSGQAFFHVAKNPQRPFIVDAGSTTVTAVGTAFDVARSADGVSVTVVEGKVAVTHENPRSQRTPAAKPTQASLLLRADEQVVLTPANTELAVRSVNGAAEAAWTAGSFVFTDQTLAEVVQRFNLYNRRQIRIVDPALAARRVSGVFKVSDPESLVEFVRGQGSQDDANAQSIRIDEPAN